MSTFKSFRPTPVARELLEDVEYGQRSELINRCLERYGKEELQINLKEKDFYVGNNGAGASSKPNGSLENSTTPSNAPEASQCKPPASEQNILRKLSNSQR
jgi:hypothetical protein